jgi:hypothetical protein
MNSQITVIVVGNILGYFQSGKFATYSRVESCQKYSSVVGPLYVR